MKQFLSIVLLCWSTLLFAQEDVLKSNKWRAYAGISQNPAVLLTPSFNPIHPGFNLGAIYQWNNHEKHRLVQYINGGFVYHKHVQKAPRIYTELAYELRLNRFSIVPLAIGGGYVMSISDLTTLKWNPGTREYEKTNLSVQHNWVVSLGPSLSYETNLNITNRPVSIFLDYRIQVQGILIAETSPFIAYAPLQVGIQVPFSSTK